MHLFYTINRNIVLFQAQPSMRAFASSGLLCWLHCHGRQTRLGVPLKGLHGRQQVLQPLAVHGELVADCGQDAEELLDVEEAEVDDAGRLERVQTRLQRHAGGREVLVVARDALQKGVDSAAHLARAVGVAEHLAGRQVVARGALQLPE